MFQSQRYVTYCPKNNHMKILCFQIIILALALEGSSGKSKEEGLDSWSPTEDYVVFRSGGQLLPRYAVHFTGELMWLQG